MATIIQELEDSSLLLVSLNGVRTLLERELGLTNLVISTADSALSELQRRISSGSSSNNPIAHYPYGFLSLSELTVVNNGNNKIVGKYGYSTRPSNATQATVSSVFIFPFMVQISLHYLDDNPVRVLRMAEAILILGQVGCFTFDVAIGDNFEFEVRVELPTDATIPIVETDSERLPNAQEIEIPLIIHTKGGFSKEVFAVNGNPVKSTVSFRYGTPIL